MRAAGQPGLVPLVRVGAAVAALGSLLALILGVSRTTLAMARDRHLPRALAAVHPRFGSPAPCRGRRRVSSWPVLAAVVDLRGAIGFSSFAVLLYYAIANAAAFTLGGKVIPVLGLVGCVVLACSLPLASVLAGLAVYSPARRCSGCAGPRVPRTSWTNAAIGVRERHDMVCSSTLVIPLTWKPVPHDAAASSPPTNG